MESSNSPKVLYKKKCDQLRLHCNTAVFSYLPDDPDLLAQIEHLDISRNCLGRNGVKPLMAIVSLCHNLVQLNLAGNYLSNESVADICEVLRTCCPKLSTLDLSSNPISNPSGKLLVRFVGEKSSLSDVRLDSTLMNAALSRIVVNKALSRQSIHAGSTTGATVHHYGLSVLSSVSKDVSKMRSSSSPSKSELVSTTTPASAQRGEWAAMETIWNLAAVAAPPSDGWTGLASVMACVKHDNSIATGVYGDITK